MNIRVHDGNDLVAFLWLQVSQAASQLRPRAGYMSIHHSITETKCWQAITFYAYIHLCFLSSPIWKQNYILHLFVVSYFLNMSTISVAVLDFFFFLSTFKSAWSMILKLLWHLKFDFTFCHVSFSMVHLCASGEIT